MKIAINACFGGFGLSKKAYNMLGINWDGYGYDYNKRERRTDPDLINAIETLGEEANGSCASLKVVEIPDDVCWEIDEYDGWEEIREVSRTWS